MKYKIVNLKNSIEKRFTSNFLFQYLFIPNLLITFYSGILAVFLSDLYPVNINLIFSVKLFLLSLISLLSVITSLVILLIVKKDLSIKNKKVHKRKIKNDLLLILIPIVPIINYIYRNKEILSLNDSIIILIVILSLLLSFIILIPKLLDNYSSARILRSLSTAFFFAIFNMATISGYFSWLENGNFVVQLGLFLLSFFILWILLGMKKNGDMVFFILTFFWGNSLILCIPQNNIPAATFVQSYSFEENNLLNLTKGKSFQTTPNIYLLVYDSYVSSGTMQNYGINNRDQEKYLENLGFVLYPNTYSVGSHTLSTMNKILNVSLNDYGHMRRGVSGDGIVQRILKENTYITFGIFPNDYLFRAVGPKYDFYFPEKLIPPYKILLIGIFMGEFRFDIGFDTINHAEYVKFKQEIFTHLGTQPVFIYTHSDKPGHSQNSGSCLENETQLFYNRLLEANNEMIKDVSIIIKNDPQAILIIAGDHGPYLTKNCYSTEGFYNSSEISRLDIQDRFGTFLAIRWPSHDFEDFDDIVVLQDIFPIIFSYILKDDSLMQSKIEPNLIDTESISGVSVKNGVIIGGIDNGEQLFINENSSN